MRTIVFAALAIGLLAPGVYAGENYITPMGASCAPCDTYGYCGKQLTYAETVRDLDAYYGQRGFKVSIVRQFGRFLEANIYRNGAVVEKIIVDRRTGRIRPIHY